MGKDGKPIVPPGATMIMMNSGRMQMMTKKQSLQRLADMLSNQLGRPVIDKQRATGEYDYTLEFSPEGLGGGPLGGSCLRLLHRALERRLVETCPTRNLQVFSPPCKSSSG